MFGIHTSRSNKWTAKKVLNNIDFQSKKVISFSMFFLTFLRRSIRKSQPGAGRV